MLKQAQADHLKRSKSISLLNQAQKGLAHEQGGSLVCLKIDLRQAFDKILHSSLITAVLLLRVEWTRASCVQRGRSCTLTLRLLLMGWALPFWSDLRHSPLNPPDGYFCSMSTGQHASRAGMILLGGEAVFADSLVW